MRSVRNRRQNPPPMSYLPRGRAIAVFAAFAFAYFLSALVRAMTATLAPTLVAEFALSARDLGLLAGGYFLGFSLTQWPLGNWLDRYGPKRVELGLLAVALLGCLAFATASSFATLLLARVFIGVGVSACLMAPLTGYRRWFTPQAQMSCNAWMLMMGSLGMVASTLPVQWLLPLTGWRVMFVGVAALVLLAMLAITWQVPAWTREAPSPADAPTPNSAAASGYSAIWRHPYFLRLVPLGFFSYGGLVAMQTLWAGPWLVRVAGYTPDQAAGGLFWINVAMLVAFWLWGLLMPTALRHGWDANRLITWGLPLSFVTMALIIVQGAGAGTGLWALFCVASTFVATSQPALALAFPAAWAGRALSAYNLVIFAGVFVVQWGVGLLVDGLRALDWAEADAYGGAMAVFLACCVLSWLWFLAGARHNAAQSATTP